MVFCSFYGIILTQLKWASFLAHPVLCINIQNTACAQCIRLLLLLGILLLHNVHTAARNIYVADERTGNRPDTVGEVIDVKVT